MAGETAPSYHTCMRNVLDIHTVRSTQSVCTSNSESTVTLIHTMCIYFNNNNNNFKILKDASRSFIILGIVTNQWICVKCSALLSVGRLPANDSIIIIIIIWHSRRNS